MQTHDSGPSMDSADSFPTDGSQWDKLFADGERFRIGDLDAEGRLHPAADFTGTVSWANQ